MTTYCRRLLTIAFFALLSLPTFAEEVNFINDNVRAAIDRAAVEGKLVFLDFWADYCSPCKLMEKYTFTDPSVIERMNGSYVPVRINIETFDGYDLKAQYNVKLLPTIIVLNSKGKQVARFEESMSGSKLSAILAQYDTKKNRKKIAKPAPEPVKEGFSPDFDIVAKPSIKSTTLPTKPVEKPALVAAPVVVAPRPINSSIAPTVPNNATKSTFKPPVFGASPPSPATNNSATKPEDVPANYNSAAVNRSVTKVEKPTDFNATTTTPANRAVTKVEKPANFNTPTTTNARAIAVNNTATTETKKASVTSITAGYFTIQVGNFVQKENADRVSKTMKTQFDGKQKVFLLSGGSETLTTHRVMVGGFKTHKDATEFKKKNQINGFVQNYSSYIK
jgi:thioredoxin-related protein/cell division septation protein DedD